MDSITNPKAKTTKEKEIRVRSLVCSTLGVEGRVGAPGWGLRKLNYSHEPTQTKQKVG